MGKDFQVPYTVFNKEKDSFNCFHCEKSFMNKKSFLRYGCVPSWNPYILCRSCAYKAEYGSKKLKKAKENNVLELKNSHK
jgi:hypothetical protein